MRDNRETPELEDVLEEFADALRSEIRTCVPGVVVRYDSAKQTADVRPQIKRVLYSNEGVRSTVESTVIANVRVGVLRANGMFAHFPIKAGTHVMIHFAETDLSEWRRTGQSVDAGDDRRLTIAGAYAVPNMQPDAMAIEDLDPDNITIGSTSGLRMVLKPNRVEFGTGDAAALASVLDRVMDYVVGHGHTAFGSPPNPLPTPPFPLTSASAVLKVSS